jgi:hypothetical protein
LVGKSGGKRQLQRLTHRLGDIKKDLKEKGWEHVDCVHMPQNRDHWQTPMNLVIKLAGNFIDKLNTEKEANVGKLCV